MKSKPHVDTPAGNDAHSDHVPTYIPDVVVEPRNPKEPPDVDIIDPSAEDSTEKQENQAKPEKTRIILINPQKQHPFVSNYVNTSKYNIFTFFPYFLYEQFRRASNVFFLLMASIQQIPGVSPTGKFTTAAPLAFIICVSAVKEILEDRKRHKGDTKTNSQEIEVLRDQRFQPTKWKDIMVGDFVRLKSESFVPADLVLYSSSEPLGMCYIETANLDGETNLKLRQALPRTAELKEEADLAALKGSIECGVPNRMIYEFSGTLNFEGDANPHLLGPDQLVLRGAKLRNTKWIIGQAIYTGHETKLLKNSTKAPLKQSTLDKATNVEIAILFAALILISAISSIKYATQVRPGYIPPPLNDNDLHKFLQFLTFILLYNNLIPISLSVTLEFVRFWQALFINWDDDIYHVESRTGAQARTSNLNEELGQIRYIFSDKTGTLTRNIMEFKGCTVSGILYTYEVLFPNAAKGINMKDSATGNPLVQQIKKGNTMAEEFLLALTVCHYVIPERKTKEDGSEELIYNAASPDERALVEGAEKFGYVFISRTATLVEITVHGDTKMYTVLNLIEFTSTRKRMTVILRCPDGKIRLYCKGADSIILERVVTKSDKEKSDLKTTEEHLDYFANEGLRTLCVAVKLLSEDEYREWNIGFQKAMNSNDRENEVAKSAELIESNLTLVGSTAIEDKLQENVPESIADFLEAGISVWVLTGDKQETAINIGNSCRLITPSMTLLIINESNEDDTLACIVNFAKTLNVNLEDMKKQGKKAFRNIVPCHAVVVIDGKTLSYALTDRIRSDFLCLCCSCKAAIVCRAAPMQKAEIVEYVTKLTGAVTLAIGDGANDVAMIQKAHVGIGISGNEGLQAASASDYAIAQFYFLKKLLFVHGAWNHDRITKAIFYSFYKNITLYIIELWFATNSFWSGQIIFDRWAITAYNLVFVCMQPLAMGLFEQNCSMKLRMKHPHLYLKTSNGAFSVKRFLMWIATSLFHSILLYWISIQFYSTTSFPNTIWKEGKEGSYLVLGNTIFTSVVIVVSLKMGLETRAWTKYTHFAIWGSIALWFIFLTIYSFLWTMQHLLGNDNFDMAEQLYTSPAFWISVIIIPAAALMPDLIYASFVGTICKTEPDTYREAEILREKEQGVPKEEPINKKVKSKKTQTDKNPKSKKKVENMASEPKASQKKTGNPKKASFEDEVITDKPDTTQRKNSFNSPQFTKASLQPTSSLIQRNNNRVLTNELGATKKVSEPVGPRVLTYSSIRKSVVIGKLRSIPNKVDEDPEIDARPKPTMMEIFEALHLQKLSQEEKTKASTQQRNTKSPEDPIGARHRPSATEDFTAIIQPGWSGVRQRHAEKTKDLIKPKKESDSVDEVPPRLDETTDPEGNLEEENPETTI